MLGPIVRVCVLTGAGHGGRVGVSAEESRVAVADGGRVSERVAVRRTLGTGRVQGPGFVEPRGTGCRGTGEDKTLTCRHSTSGQNNKNVQKMCVNLKLTEHLSV